MASCTVSGIYVYPIKSCRGVALETATVSAIGLSGDRLWQVVDGDRRGITQRRHPLLATVQPEPMDGGGLRLRAPGLASLTVDQPRDETTTVTSHFGLPVPAADAGDEAAAWFSELMGEPVRLVAMVDECGWRLPEDLDVFGQNAPFSDAAPILLTAQRSLTWLRERASEEFDMDRFRPNLVVSGSAPWEEDTWSAVRIGEAELRCATPWPRCTIPQIDQVTADRHNEPAKVLRRHRWCTEAPTLPTAFRSIVEGNGLFGVGCSIGPPHATLRVGDEVTVMATAPAVLPMV
ncbi:MAG TPA: MOSC N-terminal beta barrel domain-containing protein [Ilumatobacteraceae bacterium]|nr:MOSC N-terminal beta barrel domain-containing protein [Ilumatobacteraceae bacterium]